MKIEHFKQLHKNLKISVPKTKEFNCLPSDTDPTQDIPIRKVELSAAGIPINVKNLEGKMQFNNVKPENFTSIEKRHNDKFDVLGEYQQLAHRVASSGTTTDFINPKKNKQNED